MKSIIKITNLAFRGISLIVASGFLAVSLTADTPSTVNGGYGVTFNNQSADAMSLTVYNGNKTVSILTALSGATQTTGILSSTLQGQTGYLWCPQGSSIILKKGTTQLTAFSFPGGSSGSVTIPVSTSTTTTKTAVTGILSPTRTTSTSSGSYTISWAWSSSDNTWTFTIKSNQVTTTAL